MIRPLFTTVLLLVVVAGVAAINCYVNDSQNRPLKCTNTSFPGGNTCAVCTSGGSDYGLGGCTTFGGQCDGVKSNCENVVKGTFSSCTTDLCNKCTSAAAVVGMVFPAVAAAAFAVLLM